MSKQSLEMEIALLHLEDVETPEKKLHKKRRETKHTTPEFRETVSERMKKLWSNPEFREKQLEHLRSMEHTGHAHSSETRKKMRAAWTEERRKKQSETLKKSLSRPEVQEKLRNRVKGYIWVTNGEDSKLVPPDQIPEGWRYGRA